jgi:hypothetical protein
VAQAVCQRLDIGRLLQGRAGSTVTLRRRNEEFDCAVRTKALPDRLEQTRIRVEHAAQQRAPGKGDDNVVGSACQSARQLLGRGRDEDRVGDSATLGRSGCPA